MTAVTATPAESPARTRSRGPHGLTWVMLRLHSSALWFWALLIAVTAGTLLWAYGWGADAAWAETLGTGCDDSVANQGCDYAGPAYNRYDTAITLGSTLINLVPLLTALWAGAALIGRELENGTARLAWTQSVSPARWLAAKLAVPAALLVSGTIVLTLVHRMMWTSHTELWEAMGTWEWHDGNIFVANGPLAVARVLLGLAVGVLVGLLARRALPALGISFLCMASLMYVLDTLRPHLWPVETLTKKDGYPDYIGMVVGDGALTSTGARVPDPICVSEPGCLAEHDIVGYYRDYHPSSHFLPLQLMETGVALALAALAVLASFWLLRRRTGAAV